LFKQITIVGTGLIGGSIGLALKRARFKGKIVGCDEAEVIAAARKRKAIDVGAHDCGHALRGSDLVILATPIGGIIDFLDRFGPLLGEKAFVTDVGSTKEEVVARARQVFKRDVNQRFLGGHPMAGKEHGGIEHADAKLFEGALWFLTPAPDQDLDSGPAAGWAALVAAMGARVMTIAPERHDRLVAWTSHLPQLVSTALASSLADFGAQFAQDFSDDLDPREAAGSGLRDMTRLAASPYGMWRDIALTNTANIADALSQLEQKLAHLRENLRTRALAEEFSRAQSTASAPGSVHTQHSVDTQGRVEERGFSPASAPRRKKGFSPGPKGRRKKRR
jgi:prephenate dehydrogenase